MTSIVNSLTDLDSQEVVHWVGTEMALGGGTPILGEENSEFANCLETPVVWTSDAIPFAQFVNIDIPLANGSICRLLSQDENGDSFCGLYLIQVTGIKDTGISLTGCIYRTRELTKLPVGQVKVSILRRAKSNSVIELELSIGTDQIRMLSGEIDERGEGMFEFVECDESILVQVNEQRPKPRIKRGSHSEPFASP